MVGFVMIMMVGTVNKRKLMAFEHLLGLTEYASFLTKFENRTAKIMTGNPTNCTGNSNSGGCSSARTALSPTSNMLNRNADNSARDGNIICRRIFKSI